MDRLAHAVVAAERERHVRHAAGGSRSGELHLQTLDGLDERDGVGVVFLHPRGDREDVCVEDDVLRLEADDLGQQVVRPPQDGDPALDRLGLAPLVEGHDDDRRSVTPAEASLAQELGLALLERDRVDDTLALELPKAGLDDRELRAVDHDGDGRDVGLGGNPPQEAGHRGDAVEHRLIHVHVDQLGAIGDLLAGDVDRLVLGAGCDEPGELARAGHVRPLADVDEGVARRRDDERFEARQAGVACRLRDLPGWQTGDGRRDGSDVSGRRAAAAAGDVEQTVPGPLAERLGHLLRRLVVATQLVRQAGVRVGRDRPVGDARENVEMLAKLLRSERAVETHDEWVGVADAVPEGLDGLARQRSARRVDDGPRDDQRQPHADLVE